MSRLRIAASFFILWLLVPGVLFSREYPPFDDYLKLFDHPAIARSIGSFEGRVFSRVTPDSGLPRFDGHVMELYLLASGITDEDEHRRYMERFNVLVESVRRKTAVMNLNRYNFAEYLLVFLHDELFSVELKGKDAGYNIGIRETFDSGKFNCYKSALIYNALLESFGIESSYVTVPNHIFSRVMIDGVAVDVETTTRHGFDPDNQMAGRYAKRFTRRDVRLTGNRVTRGASLDRLRVLVQVYNNRSLVYAGDVNYSGFTTGRDFPRAAAISLLGNYLSMGRDRYIIDNTLYKIFQVYRNLLEENSDNLEDLSLSYTRLAASDIFTGFSASHVKNMEIAVYNILGSRVKKESAILDAASLERLIKLCDLAGRLIVRNRDILEALYHNAAAVYVNTLVRNYDRNSVEGIEEVYRKARDFTEREQFRESASITRIRNRVNRNILVDYVNLAATRYNGGDRKGALLAAEHGLKLSESMGEADPGMVARLKDLKARLK